MARTHLSNLQAEKCPNCRPHVYTWGFVLYSPYAFYALEVKNSANPSPTDLRGLKELKKNYPEATVALLYRGKEKFVREGILCLPVEEFLRTLNPAQQAL